MDIMAIAGMLFVLLMTALIGGIVLLFPLARRLGAYLDRRLTGQPPPGVDPRALEELRRAVHSLQAEVERLTEQQAFTEALLAREHPRLASGDSDPVRATAPDASVPPRA